jgi:hypothetical protein
MIFGGYNQDNEATNSVYIFNSNSNLISFQDTIKLP